MLIPLSLNCFFSSWFPKSQQPLQPKVVIIDIVDPINFKECAAQLFCATTEANTVGVILRINSGGGSAGDFSVIHDMVKKLASKKPVICLVMGRALSGGYLIASAASMIMAHSCSEIGSIGATVGIDRYSNMHVKDGTVEADSTVEIFKAGEFKSLFSPYQPELTESQRAYIQASLMKTYNSFIKLIARNRNLLTDDYKTWAEGKVFDAPEALGLGLIDEIGTIFDAEEKIMDLIVERNPYFGETSAIQFFYYV